MIRKLTISIILKEVSKIISYFEYREICKCLASRARHKFPSVSSLAFILKLGYTQCNLRSLYLMFSGIAMKKSLKTDKIVFPFSHAV